MTQKYKLSQVCQTDLYKTALWITSKVTLHNNVHGQMFKNNPNLIKGRVPKKMIILWSLTITGVGGSARTIPLLQNSIVF